MALKLLLCCVVVSRILFKTTTTDGSRSEHQEDEIFLCRVGVALVSVHSPPVNDLLDS